MKKKLLGVLLVSACIFAGCASSEDKAAAKAVDDLYATGTMSEIYESYSALTEDQKGLCTKGKEIEEAYDVQNQINGLTGVPTQSAFDEVFTAYTNLTGDQKNMINSANLDKYRDIDLKSVNEVKSKVDSINDSTSFSTVVEVKKAYDSLGSKEKGLISITKLDKHFELSDIEKAALVGANDIKSVMKDPSSINFSKIVVKDETAKMNFYWVCYDYSGANSFGANKSGTSCFGITKDFRHPFWSLGHNLDDEPSMMEYVKSKASKQEVDVEKIMYFLD